MNNKDWGIPFNKPDIAPEIDACYNKLLALALSLRGIRNKEDAERFISCNEELLDPFILQDMKPASDRLKTAITSHETVAVYGDYDVDGITSCCLMTDYLKSKNLTCLCHIPNREDEGYGLSVAALDDFKAKGASLVITVDCGITAIEEASHAKEIGIDLIITDHHECLEGKLPEAVAVVDYKRPDDSYPNKILAGVGVAFKLICACEGNPDTVLERYADLVAIGTVADVMPLVKENRLLVNKGLLQLNANPRPGIKALLNYSKDSTTKDSVSKNKPQLLTSTSISFTLAPRINAAGRMGKASKAANLLNETSSDKAASIARELNELNVGRQRTENEIMRDAEKRLEEKQPDGPIVLADNSWHQGVIGIAASRLSEKYCVPSIMICIKNGIGKGSCRSYGNFNLHSALKSCEEHLISFGGHALAAGLNIQEENIESFREALREYYLSHKPEDVPEVVCDILIDSPELLSVENVKSLDCLEPYGTQNTKPKMCIYGAQAKNLSQVGKDGKHMKMKVVYEGKSFDCIFFSKTKDELGIKEGSCVDIAFTPQINEYRDNASVQLILSAVREHPFELSNDIILNWKQVLYDNDSKQIVVRLLPERHIQESVWKYLIKNKEKPVSNVVDILFSYFKKDTVKESTEEGIAPEKFSICLIAFLEAGLLLPGNENSVLGNFIAKYSGKKVLEATDIISTLRKYADERSS